MKDHEALAIHGGRPVLTTPAPPWPEVEESDRRALLEVLDSRIWGGYHPSVAELERRMAAMHGATFGIAVANGTVSLEIALLALGIGPGDEVIVPPISFVASATAIAREVLDAAADAGIGFRFPALRTGAARYHSRGPFSCP